MGLVLRTVRRLLLPRWLTRRMGRGARWVALRVVIALLIVVAVILVFLLWRDLTYTLPARRVVRRVAETAGVKAEGRDELIAVLRERGFTTLAAGMTRDEVRRVFQLAHGHEELQRFREAYYFNFLGQHEYGFYLDYDTADRLRALTWERDFFHRQPAEPLAIRPAPD